MHSKCFWSSQPVIPGCQHPNRTGSVHCISGPFSSSSSSGKGLSCAQVFRDPIYAQSSPTPFLEIGTEHWPVQLLKESLLIHVSAEMELI